MRSNLAVLDPHEVEEAVSAFRVHATSGSSGEIRRLRLAFARS
ncbi:MAG: hypothetical protein ABSH05_14505 [Bryobacteraceae bacterium]